MPTLQEEITKTNNQRAECNELIKRADVLDSLQKNRAFKEIFTQGFFDEYLKNQTALLTKSDRDAAVRRIEAVAVVNDYLKAIVAEANEAEKILAQLPSEEELIEFDAQYVEGEE